MPESLHKLVKNAPDTVEVGDLMFKFQRMPPRTALRLAKQVGRLFAEPIAMLLMGEGIPIPGAYYRTPDGELTDRQVQLTLSAMIKSPALTAIFVGKIIQQIEVVSDEDLDDVIQKSIIGWVSFNRKSVLKAAPAAPFIPIKSEEELDANVGTLDELLALLWGAIKYQLGPTLAGALTKASAKSSSQSSEATKPTKTDEPQ